jgi:hypothetical protein
MSQQSYKPGHFPPEFYKDLPPSVQLRICRCIQKDGWSLDPKTGWWVCGKCKLPSRYCAVRFCENCEKPFVPLVNPGTIATDWSDACASCHPRPGYNVTKSEGETP